MDTFGPALRDARERAGWTQARLAGAAGISIHTLSAYERGRRAPVNDAVIRRLAASLGIEPTLLLRAAALGFDVSVAPEERVRMTDLQLQIERYPWPALMNNENLEVVGMNTSARTLAGLDIGALTEPGARHLLRLLLEDLGAHLSNREDVVRRLAAILKSDRVQPGGGPNGPRFMPAVVEWLGRIDPGIQAWLFGIWGTTPPWEYGNRLAFRAEWHTGDGAALAFNCLVTPWSNFLGVWAFDWLPADGPSWEWFHRRRGIHEPVQPIPWSARIEERRRAYGLTRRDVATLARVSESTVYQWERGTRRPTPAHLSALVQGMPMDGATAGLIAEGLTFDAVPSAAYRYLRGETIAGRPDLAALEVQEIDVGHIEGEIETHPWPCLVVDGAGVIACANRKAWWLLEHVSGTAPGQRPEMFALVGSKWFRDRCLDWASCVPVLLEFPARLLPRPPEPSAAARRFVDSQPGGRETIEEMERLRAGYDPEPASRAFSVLRWREGHVDLTFHCVVSPWNIWDPYVAIDLHPGDGVTWEWLAAQERQM